MPRLKELEMRLRDKYNYPDDETTRKTPSESILIGGVMRVLRESGGNSLTYKILTGTICVVPRLQNLVAMLWKACKAENITRLDSVKQAMSRCILLCQNETDIEKMANYILSEMAKILPSVTDDEWLIIRQERNKTNELLQQFDQELSQHLEVGRSIFEDYIENDEPDLIKGLKKPRLKLSI